MSRYIDADALKEDLKKKRDYLDTNTAVGRGEYIAINKALTIVDEQPTVDAVPVVRCRECRWRHDDSSTMWLPCMEIKTSDDWFCADGERRTDEQQT